LIAIINADKTRGWNTIEKIISHWAPPVQYIDYLMKHINRKYYVALLNAAEFYGAAHQRPQQYSVVCEFPSIRDLSKKIRWCILWLREKQYQKHG